MKKVITITLALYALAILIYSTKEEYHSEGKQPVFERFFTSRLFESYYNTLKKIVPQAEKVQNPQLNKLVSLIHQSQNCTVEESHHQMEQIVALKRACIHSHNEMCLQDQGFLEKICFWERTKNDFKALHKSILDRMIRPERKVDLVQMLWLSYEQLAKNSELNGHLLDKKMVDDPHGQGYVPSIAFESAHTQFILMPRVTQENRTTRKVEIIPEFIYYLQILKSRGEKHLYVNMAERTERGQQPIASAIENLSDGDALWVVTLDKDSSFYRQAFPYANENNAEEFKTLFMGRLFDEENSKSAFYWPEKLLSVGWKRKCSDLLEEIHHRYFGNHESLSQNERQDFIELAYCEMVSSLCRDLHIHYANITCKYCVDRGPTAMAAMHCYDLYNKERHLKDEQIDSIITLALAPAIISHNRPPHRERVQRLSSVASRMAAQKPL